MSFLLSIGTRLLALAGAVILTAFLSALLYLPAQFLLVEIAARTQSGSSEALGITLIVLLVLFTGGIRERLADPYGFAGRVRLDDAFDTAGQAQARYLAEQQWRQDNRRITGGDPAHPVPGPSGGGGSGGSIGGWIVGLILIAVGPHRRTRQGPEGPS